MPDELEQRIQRALQADVADLPMTIVPSMVEDRLDRTVGSGISLPLAGGAIAAALMLLVVASAWVPGRQSSSTPGVSTSPSALVAPGIVNCPTTQPGPVPADIGEQLFGSGSAYGNDDLWVGGLGDGGVIDARPVFVADDGSIGWKLGWWRAVPGTLEISGRRLDGDAPPLDAGVPDGYGSTGFQATGLSFPTEGCWEVTGRVGDVQLTFVTYVIDLQAEMDSLFGDAEACEVTLAGVGLEVTYPATWFANEPTAEQPGCMRFSSEPIETEESTSQGLEGAGIFLGAVGGPEGPRLPSEEELDRQHRRVADLQAMRVEVFDSETGVRRLTYWIESGPDAEAGPTIVAATSSDGAGSYVLNKAVLDRMAEELAASASSTPSAQATETPSSIPTASVEPSGVGTPAPIQVATCEHSSGAYRVVLPEGWWTNPEFEDDARGHVAACRFFAPSEFDVASIDRETPIPEGAAIWIDYLENTCVGYISEILASYETTIGGYPAVVSELAFAKEEADPPYTYEYVVTLTPDTECETGGRYIRAITSRDYAGDFEDNRAILDRLMETIEIRSP